MPYTVDEAISTIGMGKFQHLLFLYAAVGSIGRAMDLMLLSYIGPAIGLSLDLQNYIFISTYIGALVGSYVWANGRKSSILVSSLVMGIFGLASVSATDFWTLIIPRTIAAFGAGGTQVYTTLFMEFVPVANRETWTVYFFLTGAFGTLIEALLAWCIVPNYSWRWLVGATSTLPSVVALMFYYLIPESLTFLSSQGNLGVARTILERVAKCNSKFLPRGELVHGRVNENANTQVENNDGANGGTPSVHVADATNQPNAVGIEDGGTLGAPLLKNHIDADQKIKLAICTILSGERRATTLLIWALYFGNSFSYRGLILLLSPSFTETPTLQYKGDWNPSYYLDTVIISGAGIIGFIIAYVVPDRVLGRRYMSAIMCFGGLICLVPQIFVSDTIFTMILVFTARIFMSASFIAVQICAERVYPTDLRMTALGIATACGWAGGMIWPALGNLLGKGHEVLPMSLFGFKIFMSVVGALFLPVETLARS